jgi:hypothetical protein
MADAKISALGGITTPATTTVIPAVHGGVTMKVDLSTLFDKIPSGVGLGGFIKYNQTPDTIGAAGAISAGTAISYVDNQSGVSIALTLANGVQGQEKTIACIGAVSDAVISPTQTAGFTSITMNSIGDTVRLQYLNTKWHILSSYGCTIV